MKFLPEDLEVRDRYKLLIGGVVPRPIAFVSTVSADGDFNLAPYSFFTAAGSNPMTLLFCPATLGDGTDKDTLRNCLPPEEGGGGGGVPALRGKRIRPHRSDPRAELSSAPSASS